MSIRTLLSAGLCVAIALVTWSDSPAQIPAKLNYQVMLTDDADQPLADQAVVMVFTIYDAESGGTALWTETQTPTTNSIGVVSVILGSVTPIGFDFDMPLWLEVEVNGETLSPMREFTAAPYAGHAAGADDSEKLGGIDASEYALLSEVGGDGHSLDADDGSPVDALYVTSTGSVQMGGLGDERQLLIAGTSNLNAAVCLESNSSGSGLVLRNEVGDLQGAFLTDTSAGGGGDLLVARNDSGQLGFQAEGNYAGSNQPRVQVTGTHRSAVFSMIDEGDDSVRLPDDAIGADEVLDEPGIASIQSSTVSNLTTGSVKSVAVRTIYVPAAGYVFVMGSAHVEFSNPDSNADRVWLGVSELQHAFSGGAQEMMLGIPASAPSGVHHDIGTVHGVFEVSAGTHNFYLNALEESGNCTVVFRQLTLMYFPTAYGGVDTTD